MPPSWGGHGPDLATWWSEAGRPGATPDGVYGPGFPRAIAGLAVGGWVALAPGLAPLERPWPGLHGALPSIALADSVALADAGEPGAGYGRPLASGAAVRRPAVSGPRTRAVFGVRSGDPELDEAALSIERRAARSGARLEMLSGTRAGAGPFGRAGRHLWGGSGWARHGPHTFEAGGAQRGAANALRSGEEQSGSAGGGFARWRVTGERAWAAAGAERGWTAHRSFAPFFVTSRRDAAERRWWAAAGGRGGAGALEGRVEGTDARVRRDVDPAFDRRATAVWGGLRATRGVASGELELEAGGGRHDRIGGGVFAPAVRYRSATRAVRGSAGIERMVVPLWSDLAPGTGGFLQDTWALRMEAEWARDPSLAAGIPGAASVGLRAIAGRTRDRALVARLPIEDLWLRLGVERDPGRWDFGLLTAGASWAGRAVAAGAEGFVLARDGRAAQAQVDPAAGFRAHGEWRGSYFKDDLALRLRITAAGVGPRESDAFPARRLPGYVTWEGGLTLSIADASVTIRARNLEDVGREQAWIDLATGREAVGTGRTLETVLLWRLFD